MAIDLTPIGQAIAAKFAAIPGIKGAGVGDLDMPPNLPWVFVLNPQLTLMERPPSNEAWEWTWPCLLIAPQYADLSRANSDLRALVVPIVEAFWHGLKLGTDGVQDSWLAAATPDTVTIGSQDNSPAYRFDVITQIRQTIPGGRTV